MKNKKFYDIETLLKKNCTYSISIGVRSSGKTFSSLIYAIKRFLKDGTQTAYLRRWHEDVIGRRASQLFSGVISSGLIEKLSHGEYTGVFYFAGKQYLCRYDEEKHKAIYNDDDCFMYMFSLSDVEHDKSTEYANVKIIIFDEFIARGVYLPDEFVLFMNALSTIIRHKTDCRIIMLGNTISKFCPYFKEMGLTNISKMNAGDIDIYEYGKSDLRVAVEYTQSLNDKEINKYFAFDNPKLNMITNGNWELPLYPHCATSFKQSDILYTYYIIFDGTTFACEIVEKDDKFFTFIHEKTTSIRDNLPLIYQLEYSDKKNYNSNIFKPKNELQKKILFFFIHDMICYSDNDVGNSIENFIRSCKQHDFYR